MKIPASAGPIAIPIKNRREPTPTDMPVNSFGDFDTMFHVAVTVSDTILANTARFVDTSNSVEWNINNPCSNQADNSSYDGWSSASANAAPNKIDTSNYHVDTSPTTQAALSLTRAS